MRLRYAPLRISLALGLALAGFGADPAPDRFGDLLQEWRAVRAQAGADAGGTADRRMYPAFLALAGEGDSAALRWCLEHFESSRPPLAGPHWAPEECVARLALHVSLVRDHPGRLDERWFRTIEQDGPRIGHDEALALLDEVATGANPARAARAQLAAARVLDDGTVSKSPRRARALALLARIVSEYPDTLAAVRARALAWRLAHLAPGCTAPDFVTHDAAGNEIRSADFRGQVVVVRLWGTNLPRELTRLRAEARLARRLWDERFALIGVSRGVSKDALREHLDDEGVLWNVAFEGPGDPGAAAAWHLAAPTTVVLDPLGVVRGIGIEGEQLELVVDDLLNDLRRTTQARERALEASPPTVGRQ